MQRPLRTSHTYRSDEQIKDGVVLMIENREDGKLTEGCYTQASESYLNGVVKGACDDALTSRVEVQGDNLSCVT